MRALSGDGGNTSSVGATPPGRNTLWGKASMSCGTVGSSPATQQPAARDQQEATRRATRQQQLDDNLNSDAPIIVILQLTQ
jgi:hypothetical protein